MSSHTFTPLESRKSPTFLIKGGFGKPVQNFVPRAGNQTLPNFGHDFGKVQVFRKANESKMVQRLNNTCQLGMAGPTYCPFGGACHTCPMQIQAKLTIGQPGDKYEQEADGVADAVMRMPDPQVVENSPGQSQIQGKCAKCGEEGEELQRQPEEEEKKKEEEEPIAAKEEPGQTPMVTPEAEHSIKNMQGSGQSLPETVQTFMEPSFGHDFSQVRIHSDAQAADTASAVNSRAFTLGRDIFFNQGQYVPESQEGKRLLAHELTHVIQQNG
jgi:hypothetical protein